MDNRLRKATWLHNNYKKYPIEWYLKDTARLDALYKREYSRFIKNENIRIQEEQQEKLNSELDNLKFAYLKHYGRSYDDDFKENRFETVQRSLAISEKWVS